MRAVRESTKRYVGRTTNPNVFQKVRQKGQIGAEPRVLIRAPIEGGFLSNLGSDARSAVVIERVRARARAPLERRAQTRETKQGWLREREGPSAKSLISTLPRGVCILPSSRETTTGTRLVIDSTSCPSHPCYTSSSPTLAAHTWHTAHLQFYTHERIFFFLNQN